MESRIRGKNIFFSAFCLFSFYFLLAACSVPNLETAACIEARTPVREFYSFHFGNEMKFSEANLKLREKFITPELFQRLSGWTSAGDPFTTGNEDFPKAFRVGECKEIAPDKVEFQVLLFWKDDVRSEQREINIAAVKQNDRWLVADVKR